MKHVERLTWLTLVGWLVWRHRRAAARRREASIDIQSCYQIHADWVAYLSANPDFDTSHVGDAAWHAMWAERYRKLLALL